MKKATIAIRVRTGIENVEGYVDRGIGIHRVLVGKDKLGKEWTVTDLATGMGCYNKHFPTRKEAMGHIEDALKVIEDYKIKRPECYQDCVDAFNKLSGNTEVKANNNKSNTEINTDKGVKKMATKKTNTETKAQLKELNEALKKEIEILKKQIESFESAVKVESISIDTFDVEGYMASRDNMHRITDELVEAIGNTKGLKFVFKNANKDVVPFSGTEWLYVSGETEADTKERKDIFKAMSFKWSAPEKAWVLAPYPIRSKKAWGAKKARKAMANA